MKTGDKVLHTRKANLEDRYMLGTFLVADDVHVGKVRVRLSELRTGALYLRSLWGFLGYEGI